ncbi:hypothetical protein [Bradyrhizobium sp. DASA03007]|uniref:hypothetical protein n=1 Tax=unclassified Bradyrhizobium TaxID=2631580 RepID=UPI003F727167
MTAFDEDGLCPRADIEAARPICAKHTNRFFTKVGTSDAESCVESNPLSGAIATAMSPALDFIGQGESYRTLADTPLLTPQMMASLTAFIDRRLLLELGRFPMEGPC